MSFFSRVFRKPIPPMPIEAPDDSHLHRELKEAKKENSTAVAGLVKAVDKQERDARFARHVISDVIKRAERMKVQNAITQK